MVSLIIFYIVKHALIKFHVKSMNLVQFDTTTFMLVMMIIQFKHNIVLLVIISIMVLMNIFYLHFSYLIEKSCKSVSKHLHMLYYILLTVIIGSANIYLHVSQSISRFYVISIALFMVTLVLSEINNAYFTMNVY